MPFLRLVACRLSVGAITLLLSLNVLAGEARRGWTKLEFAEAQGRKQTVPQGLLRGFGAELIADYDAFSIVYAPAAARDGLVRAAAAQGWSVRDRDQDDVLRVPGGNLDTRVGLGGHVSPGASTGEYTNGRPGLFLLQLAGPPKKEWLSELASMGWNLARYVPHNGYIAVGVNALRLPTRRLPFVQWVDLYHPHQKNAALVRDDSVQPLVFDLPTGPELDEAIDAIAAVAEGPVRIDRGALDTAVHATMSGTAALKLLHQQLVIGVWPEMTYAAADERQMMSLTSNLDSTGAFPLATSATKYWSWVKSRCPDCASMPHAQWQISIADTGVDATHPDLAGRTTNGLLYQTNQQCAGHCDWAGHGTIVAGIAAGNNALAFRDTLDDLPGSPQTGWFLGTGAVPLAGVLITKIQNSSGYSGQASAADFIQDAAAITRNTDGRVEITGIRQPAVTIQNHSFEALQLRGTYSLLTRQYDERVRDANAGFEGTPEVLVTIAAGNSTSLADSFVATGAMAKNVLTVSGTESWRRYPAIGCPSGDGFTNMWQGSRASSHIAGYIKPDVLAPASAVISTHLTIRNQKDFIGYCPKQVRAYYEGDWDSVPVNDKNQYGAPKGGTSFAAPVAAGAALIVKRHMATTPQATSPALTKALLIAGARSIRGGEDRRHDPPVAITSVPSQQQGFGRLSLVDILDPSQPKPFIEDQADFYALMHSGEKKTARLKVRDHTRPVKAVLVWSDAPANPTDSNPQFAPLVNDLDLEVRPVGGATLYLGNRMGTDEVSVAYAATGELQRDTVNNVEAVRVLLGPAAEFDVTVRAGTIAADGNPSTHWIDQDWAIVVLNADVVSPFNPAVLPGGISPDSPGGLQAISQGNTVSLSWSPVSGAAEYLVQRQTGTLPWESVLPRVTATTINDTPPSETRVVGYRVIALATQSKSEPSGTVTVCLAPAITSLTRTSEFRYGDSAAISVVANGPSLSYQWYRGQSGDISRPLHTATSTSSTLLLTLQYTDSYWVRVTSTCFDGTKRSIDSSTIQYSVSPRITASPVSTSIPSGGRTLLSVNASGTFLEYQWYETTGYSSTSIPGATMSTLLTPAASTEKKYWVKVTSGTAPSINSNVATVSICSGPTISGFTATGSGDDFRFTVTMPSAQMNLVTFHWYSGIAGIPSQSIDRGEGSDSRMFYNITPLPATFWVRVAYNDGSCYADTIGRTVP